MREIINLQLEDIIEDNMGNYSQYVLLSRAIPSIEDGLKPVHRRILYTMHKNKIYGLTKSMRVEGAVTTYHPHGGSYPAMVGMTQTDTQFNQPITGKGNFAQHTSRDIQAGAPRYTEVKLSEFGKYLLADVDRKGVSFIPNYDGTETMPEFLPIKFPNLLTQNSKGIGVGMASNIYSFNLEELCDAMEKYIRTGEKTLLYPDLPTGGYIVKDDEAMESIQNTGRGAFTIVGKAEIDGNNIIISEIPFDTTREVIIEAIIDNHKKGKLKEVKSVHDITGNATMGIQVELKRGSDAEDVLKRIHTLTPLTLKHSFNMVTLSQGLPKLMGVYDILDGWIEWRKTVIKKGIQYKVEKIVAELNVLKGFGIIIQGNNLDEIITLVRNVKGDELLTKVMERFQLNKEQADYVINMQLKNINKDYIAKRLEQIQGMRKDKADLIEIWKSEELLNEEVISGFMEAKQKYGHKRKSEIKEIDLKATQAQVSKIVEDYSCSLTVTKDGYAYKSRRLGVDDIKLKDGDEVTFTIDKASNRGELLLFDNASKSVYKIKLDDIKETTSKNSLGVYIKSLTDGNDFSMPAYLDENVKYYLMQFDDRKTALIDARSFDTNTARKQVKNAMSKKANLLEVLTIVDNCTVSVESDFKTVEFCTADEIAKSKGSQGRFVNKTGKKWIRNKLIK